MKLRFLTSRRRLAPWVATILVATAVGVAVPVASSASTTAAPNATAAHPVIDNDFLYNELYYSATQFISRVAGADGPPSNTADPNNLPQNYNGANEFYDWWKQEMTDTSNDHMGPLGRFITAKDHF